MKRCFLISFLVIIIALNDLLHAEEIAGQEAITSKLLTPQERVVFSMLAGIMDIVTARIHTSSCHNFTGHYEISLYASGVGGQRRQNNMVTVDFKTHPLAVIGRPRLEIAGMGNKVFVMYGRPSNGMPIHYPYDPIINYVAEYGFESGDDMITSTAYLEMQNASLEKTSYRAGVITRLHSGSNSFPIEEYASNVVGWGSSWLLKEEYKLKKYWQRYKSVIGSEISAQTFLVRDLMDNSKACRIQINISGHNDLDFASQEGFLSISEVPIRLPLGISFD